MATTTTYVDSAEAAKLIRKQLKIAFPETKFRVRTRRYSGGSTIDITWMDGPTESQVRYYVDRFEGSTFDGMTDSKDPRYLYLIDGTRIHYGCDFVHTHRIYSRAMVEQAIRACADRFGWDELPEIWGDDNIGYVAVCNDWKKQDLIWRYLSGTLTERD